MVAMNAETYARDVKEVRSGGYLLYDSSWPLDARCSRATTSPSSACRSRRCATRSSRASRERILMKNIAYAGALAALLDIDMDDHRRAARREVRQEEGAARLEPQGAASSATTTRRSTSSARCRSGSRRWTRPTTAS